MPHHEAQSQLAYLREQVFELAADVESYPEFLPGWIAARILHRDGNVYSTEQVVGFGTFREHFHSTTVLERPKRIWVTSNDGIFQKFDLQWLFDPLPHRGCRVAVQVDVELRSRVAQLLFDRAISIMVGSILSAFDARAHSMYDAPTSGRPATCDRPRPSRLGCHATERTRGYKFQSPAPLI